MRSRSYRRHHYQRIFDKWVRIGTMWGLAKDDGIPFSHGEGFHGWVARTAGNMPICSRPCCGNQRRHFGRLTRQEIRANDDESDQIKEIDYWV